MHFTIPIDRAFDAVTVQRNSRRERVSAIKAGAIVATAACNPHSKPADVERMAIAALTRDMKRVVHTQALAAKQLGMIQQRVIQAKQLGATSVLMSLAELELLQ